MFAPSWCECPKSNPRKPGNGSGAPFERPHRHVEPRARRCGFNRAVNYKFGVDGFVTLFRYGVAVFMALSMPEEEQESAVRLNFSEAVFRPPTSIALAERPGVAVEVAKADQAW